MHRALSLKSVRRYVKHCTSSSSAISVSSNETWDFDFKLYNPFNVTNGATLTISCSTYVPCYVTSAVNNACTLKVDNGGLLHIDPYSTLEVKGTLTIENGGKLELHEHSKIVIQSGGKLILEPGSWLSVHYLGLVHVQAGGELIVKDNSTAPFTGLCIAPTPNPG